MGIFYAIYMPKLLFYIFIAACLISACQANDPATTDVRNDIWFTVKHHEWRVPYISTYLKRRSDTMSLPYFYSHQLATFDTMQIADDQAEGLYLDLLPGMYYVYAKGFDPLWGDTVSGGKTINIPNYDSLLQVTIAVSE
jgi:hypothetical protein